MIYLDEDDERRAGIHFADPDDSFVKNEIDALEGVLYEAAKYLDRSPLEIEIPQKGFLLQELRADQRALINNALGESYAIENAEHQYELNQVEIDECSEPMEDLRHVLRERDVEAEYTQSTFHPTCDAYAGKDRILCLRKGVAHKLADVCNALNRLNLIPHIEDCFRPPAVQEGLLMRRIVSIARMNREWDVDAVHIISSSFTAPSPGLAGHQAGAAVDLRLKDRVSKNFLDIGNGYAEGGVLSCINCPYVTVKQFAARMKFAQIMRMGGFKILPTENWHISFGDRGLGIDGRAMDHKAMYGPLHSFDIESGMIDTYSPRDIEKNYLSIQEVEELVTRARAIDDVSDIIAEIQVVDSFRRTRAQRMSKAGAPYIM